MTDIEHLDVLVVGAGLSGISAGYHLQTLCPGKTYAILEGRGAMGGAWDPLQLSHSLRDVVVVSRKMGYRGRHWYG